MRTWKLMVLPGALALAFAGLPCLDWALWTDVAAAGKDLEPPSVMVHRVDSANAGETLSVSAQVTDPSGIGNVVLWVRGELEEEFRQVLMQRVEEDRVEARVQPWPGQGAEVAYYIEARDALGNGPSFAGGPGTPYVIRLKGATSAAPAEAKSRWVLWAITAGALIVLVGGYFYYRRMSQERLHTALNAELNRLTGLTKENETALKAPARDPVNARRRSDIPQNPAEQAFWIGLLMPISHMGMLDREAALQSISVRAQHHPTLGKRFFDVPTLTRHLKWVERDEIRVTADMFADDPLPVASAETETLPN